MQAKEFSVKQMLGIFIIINSLIIAFVIGNINPASKSNPPEVKGYNFPTPLFNFENKIHFKASYYQLNFDFPSELGTASSIIQQNGCSPSQYREVISFSNFETLKIIINECNNGLNMFIPDKMLSFDNQSGKIRFGGIINPNLSASDTYDLRLIRETGQSPNIMITATINTKEMTQEELSVLLGSLIYSMDLD